MRLASGKCLKCLEFVQVALLYKLDVKYLKSSSDEVSDPFVGENQVTYISPLSGVSLRFQSKCGKMRTRITPNKDAFAVVDSLIFHASGF